MSCRILYHHRIRSDDGQAVHVRELISALRAEGNEVLECALVPKTSSEVAADRGPTGAAADRGPTGAAADRGPTGGGIWRRLSLPRAAVELMEIGYGAQGARLIRRAASSFRPDFVYERHSLHCDAGLRAARALGVPLLLEVNSPLCDEMARLGRLRFPRIARRTERRVLGGADAVFAVTEVLRGILVGLGARPERTCVVPNGASPERYGDDARAAGAAWRATLGLGGDGFLLGFVGYMRDWHRLDLAIGLLARPHLASVHLVLIGEGPALPDVLDRARALGVASRVHALGNVTPDALPGHVCALDAALIPAINGYASPLKLFDSLAAGVPTLAPRQPNLEEIVIDGDNGVLFEPDSADALDSALTPLVEDRELGGRIGARGRASLAERGWTWRDNARRVVAAFERLQRGEAVG